MSLFEFRARDRRGRTLRGEVRARTKAEARAKVARKKLQVVSVRLIAADHDDADIIATPLIGEYIYVDRNGQIQIELSSPLPKTKELIVFTKQFSTMLSSGVPMIQALGILCRQLPSRGFRRALRRIRSKVENGSTLSAALSAFPRIFDALYVAMVEAGEASGSLDVILLKLVSYIERTNKIKGHVRSALAYPVLVLVVAIIVVAGLLVFVVPTFAQQYAESERDLPALTQVVIDLSEHLVRNWLRYLGGIVAGLAVFYLWIQTKTGRLMFDAIILRVPGVGLLLKKIAVGRFCATMASMLSSGVNLLEALSICAASSGNKTVETFVLSVRKALEKGEKFSEPLARGNLFPEMVVSMVAVGETTGALDEMLSKVSDFYEEEVDLAVQTMLSMIEPVMIIIIGVLVGFIVIAMYLPVFDLADMIN